MPNPSELLEVARLLLNTDFPKTPSDAQLRRAVSTAYYALFHKILRAAAARFVGPDQSATPAFSLIYRGFNHRGIRKVCEALRVSTLKGTYKHHLCREAVSQDMRDFAGAFTALQDARHLADYDPAIRFLPSDVSSLVDAAKVAVDTLDRVSRDEQTDVLALMMVGART